MGFAHLTGLNVRLCPAAAMTTLQSNVSEKDLACRKLKEQLDALEEETAARLADMDQYKTDIMVSRVEDRQGRESSLIRTASPVFIYFTLFVCFVCTFVFFFVLFVFALC